MIHFPFVAQPEISCFFSRALLRYAQHHHIEKNQLLCDIPVSYAYLEDYYNWISIDIWRQLIRNIEKVQAHKDLLNAILEHMKPNEEGQFLQFVIDELQDHETIFWLLPHFYSILFGSGKIGLISEQENSVVFHLVFPPEFHDRHFLCQTLHAFLENLPRFWNGTLVHVERIRCQQKQEEDGIKIGSGCVFQIRFAHQVSGGRFARIRLIKLQKIVDEISRWKQSQQVQWQQMVTGFHHCVEELEKERQLYHYSQQFFTTFQKALFLPFVTCDIETGKILQMNHEAELYLQLDESQAGYIYDFFYNNWAGVFQEAQKSLQGDDVKTFQSVRVMDSQMHFKFCNVHLFRHPTKALVYYLLLDITERKDIEWEIGQQNFQVSLVKEVAEALLLSQDLEEILYVIITAVTAGQGMSFNRAFLLMKDHEHACLHGKLAVGPSNGPEANLIWNNINIQHWSLRALLHAYHKGAFGEQLQVNRLIHRTHIDLKTDDRLIEGIKKGKSFILKKEDSNLSALSQQIMENFHMQECAIVPLSTTQELIGMLIVDNKITLRPIEESQVNLLQIFASFASYAIERANLLQQQQQQLEDTKLLNRELKEKQAQLFKAEKLSALGEMAANVAHEIRNPLVTIGGFVRRILKMMEPERPEIRYIEIVIREINRLESILKNVLEFSKTKPLQLEPINIIKLLDEALQFFENDFQKIIVEKNYAFDSIVISGDADKLRQVFINLFKNSIIAMKREGKLMIWVTLENTYVKIGIRDSGPGIDTSIQEKIFEPFVTTRPDGVGLGLSLSSKIITRHNGYINVENSPEGGAEFHIILPRSEESTDVQKDL